MAQMTGGRAVVESLMAQGVDTVFGLISIHMLGVYDALHDVQDRVRFVGGRHEQAVTFMADGYARATGRPGVCFTSTGPGAANTLGAMGEAWAGSIPVLQVTSNVDAALIDGGRGVLHEPYHQREMFASVTDWTALCRTVEEAPRAVFEAFERFKTRRPRPIAIEVATDAIHKTGEAEILPARDFPRQAGDPALVERAAQALAKARRPLLWAGGGVLTAGAWEELRQLAELLDAPVVTTQGGKGAIPSSHALALGCIRGGRAYGENPLHEFVASCDVALVVGSRLAHGLTSGVGMRLPETIIHVDLADEVFNKNYPASVAIRGDVKAVMGRLGAMLEGKDLAKPESFRREIAKVKAGAAQALHRAGPNQQRTMDALREVIPSDGIVVADATVPAYWAAQGWAVEAPRTYISPHGWAGIGFGWPASLGAKVGMPQRKVVLMSGDGGFQLNLQELATAVQERIPVVAVIWNDNAWGVLKGMQRDRYQRRYFGTDLWNPDFVKLAQAYGVAATRVNSLAELSRTLEGALAREEFHLIEVAMPEGFANFR